MPPPAHPVGILWPTHTHVSFYSQDATWADILWPLPEDWKLAHDQPAAARGGRAAWDRKKDALVFRGSATGHGVTPATNRRLQLARMRDEEGGLDVGIVSWNDRWKCEDPGTAPRRPDPAALQRAGIRLVPRLDMTQQHKYRYVLYLAGHCAANRYSALLRQGSVILKVDDPDRTPGQLWFFHRLTPWKDHVPVKADLSDLHEKLQWCREHPQECIEMVAQCGKLVRTTLSTQSILRYAACALNQLPRPEIKRAPRTQPLQNTPIVSEHPPPKRYRRR